MRVALGIEYNGSQFFGWQRQSHAVSIQQCVEEAITKVANTPVRVHVAGRTDTGVHATEQIVHFDSETERDFKAWVMGVNTYLPKSIAVLWALRVADDFHARFSAQSRRYRYVILNRPVRPALLDQQVTWVHRPLNHVNMSAAARHLVGEHDFSSYRALACQAKSPVRTVHEIMISRLDEFVFMDIHADGFLHHMVRNIAGVLIMIGTGEHSTQWSKSVLVMRDRTRGGITAQAAGLYLVKVQYDDKYGFSSFVRWPTFAH